MHKTFAEVESTHLMDVLVGESMYILIWGRLAPLRILLPSSRALLWVSDKLLNRARESGRRQTLALQKQKLLPCGLHSPVPAPPAWPCSAWFLSGLDTKKMPPPKFKSLKNILEIRCFLFAEGEKH